MSSNIVVSNIRFPKDEWLQLKTVAYANNMSVNEYLRYLSNLDVIRNATGKREVFTTKKSGYEALNRLDGLISDYKDKPMGASEEDKIIYDIE